MRSFWLSQKYLGRRQSDRGWAPQELRKLVGIEIQQEKWRWQRQSEVFLIIIMEEGQKICYLSVPGSESNRCVSLHQSPWLPSCYCFPGPLWFYVNCACAKWMYLPRRVPFCKLILTNTNKDCPTKPAESSNNNREHLQTYEMDGEV